MLRSIVDAMATRERETDGRQLETPGSVVDNSAYSTTAKLVRVLIIENHQVVAEALEALLNDQPGLAVIGSLGSVEECRSCTVQKGLDVLVVDFHLTDGIGTEAVAALREKGCRAQIIFLTHDDSDVARLAAIEAGASAFLHKSQSPTDLIDAIRRVARGETLIDMSEIAALVHKGRDAKTMRDSLTHRELEVLRLLADGVGSRDIAARLGISYSTVRSHIRSISSKLGVHSKLEVVVRARELALVA